MSESRLHSHLFSDCPQTKPGGAFLVFGARTPEGSYLARRDLLSRNAAWRLTMRNAQVMVHLGRW